MHIHQGRHHPPRCPGDADDQGLTLGQRSVQPEAHCRQTLDADRGFGAASVNLSVNLQEAISAGVQLDGTEPAVWLETG